MTAPMSAAPPAGSTPHMAAALVVGALLVLVALNRGFRGVAVSASVG